MHSDGNVLVTMVIFLAAMVVAVPVFRRIGLGAVLGYLVAGVVIGPHALGAVQISGSVHHFAELGVVLMLFTIGLELDLKKLWGMRRAVFGLGALQLAACGVALAAAMLALGFAPAPAAVIGLTLALSSTAVAVQLMADRNLMGTGAGQAAFGVLLFQDIAAIPLLIVVSIVYPSEGVVGFQALPALGAIVGIIVAARTVLNPALRWIAANGSRELFVAFALLLVVAVMQLMTAVGVSAGLGAFLAGVLLASSEFRHELEADLEPFKGLFLGLFFMTIGAGIDLPLFGREWPRVLGLLLGFFALKAAALAVVARLACPAWRDRLTFTVLLGQGGEFGFVVVGLAVAGGMMAPAAAAWINIVIALSIAASPLLMKLHDGALARYFTTPITRAPDRDMDHSQVIIAGFGRYGQIVGRMLVSQGVATTVMDHDSETIESMRRFGFKVYYGDASRADLLEVAGAHHAKVLVVAVDDAETATEICQTAQRHFPKLAIVARARDITHLYALRKLGLAHIQRELFESSLVTGRAVLEQLGVGRYEAREAADRFRFTNIELLTRLADRRDQLDDKVFASEARRSREELERQLAAIAAQPKAGQDWHEERERLHAERSTDGL
jgi:glutathione-regulated potassium-efflux system ancillary protein KefC